ncbi:MAG: flagellar basal body rod protein FlgB [Chloroflexi bacterium]|nr:flagellar basal body rod protein FlgB [Chloroflexota bacterium]
MLNPLLGDRRTETLQQALGGLARRQQALADNIANVDTPGYKRKDVPFEAQLRANSGTGGRLATTSAGHIASTPAEGSLLSGISGEQGRTRTGRNDGNDVDIDYEMTRLAETTLRYELLTQAASSRFSTLKEIVGRS